jgi:hypothetical protein
LRELRVLAAQPEHAHHLSSAPCSTPCSRDEEHAAGALPREGLVVPGSARLRCASDDEEVASALPLGPFFFDKLLAAVIQHVGVVIEQDDATALDERVEQIVEVFVADARERTHVDRRSRAVRLARRGRSEHHTRKDL